MSKRKLFQNPMHLTPFEKKKVQEIKELVKNNRNPLHVEVMDSGLGYFYRTSDIRNYFEATGKTFDLIVG